MAPPGYESPLICRSASRRTDLLCSWASRSIRRRRSSASGSAFSSGEGRLPDRDDWGELVRLLFLSLPRFSRRRSGEEDDEDEEDDEEEDEEEERLRFLPPLLSRLLLPRSLSFPPSPFASGSARLSDRPFFSLPFFFLPFSSLRLRLLRLFFLLFLRPLSSLSRRPSLSRDRLALSAPRLPSL